MNAETSPENTPNLHLLPRELTYLVSKCLGEDVAKALIYGESPKDSNIKNFTKEILNYYNEQYQSNPLFLGATISKETEDPNDSVLKQFAQQLGLPSSSKTSWRAIKARVCDHLVIIAIRIKDPNSLENAEDLFKGLAKLTKSTKGRVIFSHLSPELQSLWEEEMKSPLSKISENLFPRRFKRKTY